MGSGCRCVLRVLPYSLRAVAVLFVALLNSSSAKGECRMAHGHDYLADGTRYWINSRARFYRPTTVATRRRGSMLCTQSKRVYLDGWRKVRVRGVRRLRMVGIDASFDCV